MKLTGNQHNNAWDKIHCDVNVEKQIIDKLRESNYDVLSVYEKFKYAEDDYVLNLANKEERILITNDKDFGELVFRLKLLSYGIVLFRITSQNYSVKIEKLINLIQESESKLKNNFIIISDQKIRIVPINK